MSSFRGPSRCWSPLFYQRRAAPRERRDGHAWACVGVYARRPRARRPAPEHARFLVRRSMTRLSEYLLPTEKQAPADAEAISHKLMVRAGLIRQMGAGMWTLAAGRLAGAPARRADHPRGDGRDRRAGDADAGAAAGRAVAQDRALEIEELFKLTDRKGSELVLAMTHEEAVTFHAAQIVRSYRDLPLILYHFQVKERDEPRPRAGVLRTREFVMKDSYCFDRDQAGLEERYELHVGATTASWSAPACASTAWSPTSGMMGGLGAHEYMAPCPAGEDEVALGDGYAANLEVALTNPDVRADRRGATRSAASRSRSSRRSRSATSSSSARATPSRSAPATWTSSGAELPIWMGSYGIGPARIVAAAVEQFADEHGISWPRALAPFAVHLVGTRQARHARARGRRARCTRRCSSGGVEVLYDDRDARPGREVRRRRAARLPAAPDGRAPRARVRRDRGPGCAAAARTGPGPAARRRARASCCGRWTSCGRASPRGNARPPRRAARPPRLRRGSTAPGPPPPRDAAPGSRCGRGRSPTRSASCGSR